MQQVASLIAALIAGLLVASHLTGCSPLQDPYQRVGTWSAEGVNDANLRAMVADPDDLALGRGTERALAVEAVPPVARLLTGHRPTLPTESSSGITAETQTQATPQGGTGNAGQ